MFDFHPTAFDALLELPATKKGLAEVAHDNLLEIAKLTVSRPWPKGTANPPPGPPYMRSQVFRDTLQLESSPTGNLVFRSPAVSPRKSFLYGQALIDGSDPYPSAYRVLPPEYYS